MAPGPLDKEAGSQGVESSLSPSPPQSAGWGGKARGHCLPGAGSGSGWPPAIQMLSLSQGQPWAPEHCVTEPAGEAHRSPPHGSTASAPPAFLNTPGDAPQSHAGKVWSVPRCKAPLTWGLFLTRPSPVFPPPSTLSLCLSGSEPALPSEAGVPTPCLVTC